MQCETCMTEILIALTTNILSSDYSTGSILLNYFNFLHPFPFGLYYVLMYQKHITHSEGSKHVCKKLPLLFFCLTVF